MTRNTLAHAYRRLGIEDLKSIVDEVLPKAESLVNSELMRMLEEGRLDPSEYGPLCERASEVFVNHRVSLAYLFGSRARGKAREDSDYDLAVLFRFDDVTVLDEIELAKDIAKALNVQADKVDVVALNKADSLLLARVFKEGRLFYALSDNERKGWERKTYLNLLRQRDLDVLYITKALKGRGV